MATLSNTLSLVRSKLQIDETTDEIITDFAVTENGINPAIDILSRDKPNRKSFLIIGNGENRYEFPSDYQIDFSNIERIQFIYGRHLQDYVDFNEHDEVREDLTQRVAASSTTGATSITLSTDTEAGFFKDGDIVSVGDTSSSETNWLTQDGATATGILTLKFATVNNYTTSPFVQKINHFLIGDTFVTLSETLKVEYTARHIHTETVDTIPAYLRGAFINLCCANTAQILSSNVSKKSSSTVSVDQIDYPGSAAFYIELSKEFMRQYTDFIEQTADRRKVKTQITMIDSDTERRHPGYRSIFHRRRSF